MSILRWNPELSVGVEAIDADHWQLIVLLNRLAVAVATGAGRDAIAARLDALIAHSEQHFQREEEAMARHGYPEAEHHRSVHRELIEDITELRREFDEGMEIGTEFIEFVGNWLLSHIAENDKPLGAYLVAAGA